MKQHSKSTIILLTILLSIQVSICQILSTLNFKSNNVVSAGYPSSNIVGLSMYFPQLIPYLNNSLFLSRIDLSNYNLYESGSNSFHQSIHMPKGYKYNCSSLIYLTTVQCIKDFILDPTTTRQKINYISQKSKKLNIDLGYDIQKSNFSNTRYMSNFKSYLALFGYASFNIELIDYGNLINSIYNRTYTVNDLISDNTLLRPIGIPITGPGITQSADSSWINQISSLITNPYFTFTFRCTVFNNLSEITISNLLSQNYSSLYLKKRLANGLGVTLNLSTLPVGINQIRLTNNSGVDGVTNSFAAALWALDISMEFAIMKGKFINFYNPLSPSNQSIFGEAPSFTPSPMLYGLLFAIYSLRDNPLIELTQIIGGTSQNIKAYGMNLNQNYRVLVINKDTNPNASGVVKIMMDYPNGIRCFYLTAPNLSSTTDVSFAGMSFIGNSSDYIGQFIYQEYKQQANSGYLVNLNYSQAVLCQQKGDTTYYTIPRGRGRGRGNYQSFIGLFSLCIISLLVLF